MQRFWRQVLSIGFAFGALMLATAARAQVQNVDFDDLGGTGVRSVALDRYADRGLLLSGGAGLFVFGPSSFAASSPDWLYASQTPGGENADAPIALQFRSPVDGSPAVTDDLSFSIADGDHLGPWTVHAYDIAGTQLALVTGTNAPRVRLTGKPFHRVVFTPSADFDGIDALQFNDVIAPSDLSFATPVAFGRSWRYLHPLTNIDPATSDPDFHTTWFKDDGSYNGPAFSTPRPSPLGYGAIDLRPLATDIGTPASGSRYTAYFTTTFEIENADRVRTLAIDLLADDGAFIYLNGQLVARHNMAAAATDTYRALAAAVDVNGISTEQGTFTILLDPAMLRTGTNFLAVSLHNQANGSSDLGLDVQMSASIALVPEPAGAISIVAAGICLAFAARLRNRPSRVLPRGGGRVPATAACAGDAGHDSAAVAVRGGGHPSQR